MKSRILHSNKHWPAPATRRIASCPHPTHTTPSSTVRPPTRTLHPAPYITYTIFEPAPTRRDRTSQSQKSQLQHRSRQATPLRHHATLTPRRSYAMHNTSNHQPTPPTAPTESPKYPTTQQLASGPRGPAVAAVLAAAATPAARPTHDTLGHFATTTERCSSYGEHESKALIPNQSLPN